MTSIDTSLSTHQPSRPTLVARSTSLRMAAVGIAAAAVIAISGTVSSSSDSTACHTWHPQSIAESQHQHILHPQQAVTALQFSWNPGGAATGDQVQHSWNPQGAIDGDDQHSWNPRSVAGPVAHSWNPTADPTDACLPS